MNKITYFILSYIISILSILISLCFIWEHFWSWLIFVITILVIPLIVYKISKATTISKEKCALISHYFIFCMILIPAWGYIFPHDNKYIVAFTESEMKANQIQELLTTSTRQTQRFIIINDRDNSKSIGISINDSGKKENYKVTLELLNSDIFDDSVKLSLNVKYTKNRLKLLKRVQQECKNILCQIDGIVRINIILVPSENINNDDSQLKSILVQYETDKTKNNQKIEKQVEKFINAIFKECCTNITIENVTYHEKGY